MDQLQAGASWTERTGLTDTILKDIHSSVLDLKQKTNNQAQAKKFGFVMSIAIKDVIWLELEVLQMKNNLALSSLLSSLSLPVGSQLYPQLDTSPDVG